MESLPRLLKTAFVLTVEVVPPRGNDISPLLGALNSISRLPFHGFNVATNPIAKPCMSAMACCLAIQEQIKKPAILHCSPRDENRLGLQSMLWGARALGIDTTLILSGDSSKRTDTRRVDDLSVFELIRLSAESGFHTGAVFDFRPEADGFDAETKRLILKKEAGASFIITQPVYDEQMVEKIEQVAVRLEMPVIMGILPLVSGRHARFLHHKVDGISIPSRIIKRIESAENPVNEGIAIAKYFLDISRNRFSGACVMPPFDRFDILSGILEPL